VARVLVVNDYSLLASWNDVRQGRSPAHFLYGADGLADAGFEVTLVSEEWSHWLAQIDGRLGRVRIPLGSIDRQAAALRFLGQADAIYAPCQTQIQALTYLRALGLLRAPIVLLAHHPLIRGRLGKAIRPLVRLMIRGVSAMPTLSRAVADEANTLSPARPIAVPLRWGPDARFYPPAEYPGQGILAAGRTGRDFVTFGRAANTAKVPATILTFRAGSDPELASFGSNVTVTLAEKFIDYSETTRMFAASRALAIPMFQQEGLCGLTSLLDALGAGKPVIITRNSNLDLDVEKLGIGRWIDPGDVQGWIDAMRFFEDNPDAATAMGRRARKLVDDGLNYASFSDALVAIVRQSIAGATQ
jgi:hypothetical protein